MDNHGYIRLSRKFFKEMYWTQFRTFSQAEAWLDLIQMARFEAEPSNKILPNGRKITVERGEIHASLRYLSARWGWSKGKVERYIKGMGHRMGHRTEQGETILTLCNYDIYNPIKSQDGTPIETPDETAARHRRDTDETNKKKEKNVNKEDAASDEEKIEIFGTKEVETINYRKLVEYFNKVTEEAFGKVRYPISDKRRKMLRARIREYGKRSFMEMVDLVSNSDFLKSKNFDFGWFIRPENYPKILEGKYNKNFKDDERNN